jgi:hypothetical protein
LAVGLKLLPRRPEQDFVYVHVFRLADREGHGARERVSGNRDFFRAAASPRPLLAPVMTITFPAILPLMILSGAHTLYCREGYFVCSLQFTLSFAVWQFRLIVTDFL